MLSGLCPAFPVFGYRRDAVGSGIGKIGINVSNMYRVSPEVYG